MPILIIRAVYAKFLSSSYRRAFGARAMVTRVLVDAIVKVILLRFQGTGMSDINTCETKLAA